MAGSRRPFADLRRTGPGRLAAGVLLAAWLVAADSARGRDPGRGPPTDTGPPATIPSGRPDSVADPPPAVSRSATVPADAADPAELDQWHQNLIRERQIEMRLRTAQSDIEAGRLIAGLAGLQALFDRDEDILVRYGSESVPCGAHRLAGRILGELPASARETYESLYGSQARQMLDAAAPDPEALGRIVRRFYHTAAGFEAGHRLAAYWTDRGHDEFAWSWWRRVTDDAAHEQRVRPVHRLLAAACCRRLGRDDVLPALLSKIPAREEVRIGGRLTTCGAVRDEILRRTASGAALAAAEASRGAIGRNVSAIGTPPAPGRALWRAGLAGEQSRHLESLARAWESHQLQNGLPIGTSQSALLVGERLVYRDFEGIRAVDVRSGGTLWFAPCVSSVGREISARQTIPADANPDPNNVMRHVVGNAGVQALATDGRRVFAIDRVEFEDAPAGGTNAGDAAAAPRSQCNTLLAFDLASPGTPPQAKWIAGGRAEGPAPHLKGHFFFGPPLPVADRLLVISEHRQQLVLSCLACDTGKLMWMQPVCSVSQPIGSDPQRSGLACAPSFGDGIVVCPTQSGVLVAVDALTGMLLWAVSHDEAELQQRQQMSAWLYQSRRPCAHAAYVNLPVIRGGRVYYLPAHSEFLHCVDLGSGKLQWRARREDLETPTATEYVAAVTDEVVAVIGRRRARGLDCRSGDVRWTVRLGHSPAGRGLCLGSHYHVPLDDGGLADLELDTGRMSQAPRGTDRQRLGNLVAGDGVIVSLSPAEIAVYPQAREERDRLREQHSSAGNGPEGVLELAELELTLGQLDEAQPRLEEILGRGAGSLWTERAADLLRQLLFRKITTTSLPSARDLARLKSLSEAPEHFGRYLVARQHAQDAGAEVALGREVLDEISHQATEGAYVVGDDPSRTVSGRVLAAEQARRILTRDAAAGDVESLITAALGARDARALRRLIGLIDSASRLDEVRLELAELLIAQGHAQQAETVLLQSRGSADAEIAGRATRLLAELWNARGLHHEAGRLYGELVGRFADVEVARGERGENWVASRPAHDPARDASPGLARPRWSGAGARISERPGPNEALQAVYNANGVQILATPRQLPFDLFDRGLGANALYGLVNRHTGQAYPETIQVPGRTFYPVSPQYLQHAFVGNFFPLGGVRTMHGVSLLERKLMWTFAPYELKGIHEVVRVGPAGPGFCTFQFRQHLFVLDPLDGRLLWHRDDLEGTAGLMHEPFLGIIGDERVLAVFATNGANYTLYDTATGAELRRGKVDVGRQGRRVLGRRLFHYTAAADKRRVRVWDALTDRCPWDEPADAIAEVSVLEGVAPGTKVLGFVRDTDEAAYVTSSGTIRVVDLPTGREIFDLPVPAEHLEYASALRVFRDGPRYFFSVQRSSPPGRPAPTATVHMSIMDTTLPSIQVEGDLLAVDAQERRVLWRRPLGKRTLLQMPDVSLPVLVSLSRMRKEDQSYLAVEVIDVQTGQTLAMRDDLLSDRLLQAAYDPEGASVELRGAKTVVRLEFPLRVAQRDTAARP